MLSANKNLISSTNSNEDAAVFQISPNLALVQTLDFITPVVNDPFIFGQIAAANSLSDIFAMGANVLNALNIAGFDNCNFGGEILGEILQGGKNKVEECGGCVVGGHSINTPEMYYGLSVLGCVEPDKFWQNCTAKIGDLLILTKPLGSGVLSTALKADLLNLDEINEAISYMVQLNFYAIKALKNLKINACTDITGFGLLNHAIEMLRDDIGFELYTNEIPLIQSAIKYANMGVIPGGSYKNRDFAKNLINTEFDILLCDAQTSGGLLLSIDCKDAQIALKNLKNAGYEKAKIIGEVVKRSNLPIILK